MKNILLLMSTISLLFVGCSSDDKDEPIDHITPEGITIKDMINKVGIEPSNIDEIDNIYSIADSTSYKLVFGRKNGNAWIAKFDAIGNEIFSTEIKDMPSHRKYGHCNNNSTISFQGEYLFLIGWFTGVKDLELMEYGDFTAFLSVIEHRKGDQET